MDDQQTLIRKMAEIARFSYYHLQDGQLYFYREDKDPNDYGWKEGQIIDGQIKWKRTHKNPRYFASRL